MIFLTENESNSKRPALVFVVILFYLPSLVILWEDILGTYFHVRFLPSFKDENNLQPELPEGLKPKSLLEVPNLLSDSRLTKEILSRSRIITYRIKDIDRLLNQYGGQKDWIKKQ